MKGKSRAWVHMLKQYGYRCLETAGRAIWEGAGVCSFEVRDGCSSWVTNSFPALLSVWTPGCSCCCSYLSLYTLPNLCLTEALCASAPFLPPIPCYPELWGPEQRVNFFPPQNPAQIYSSHFCINHKRKTISLKSMLKCESKFTIWNTGNIYSHFVCILG